MSRNERPALNAPSAAHPETANIAPDAMDPQELRRELFFWTFLSTPHQQYGAVLGKILEQLVQHPPDHILPEMNERTWMLKFEPWRSAARVMATLGGAPVREALGCCRLVSSELLRLALGEERAGSGPPDGGEPG